MRAAHALFAAVATNSLRERLYWESIDGDALISRTRSQLATKFLTEPELAEADVMVILDDDVQFAPNDLYKIVDLAREKQALAGGVYVTRSREPHIASLMWPDQTLTFGIGQQPTAVRYLATGFMAIPRKVLEAMVNHPGFETIHGPERLRYCEIGVGDMPMYDFFRPFCIDEGKTLRAIGYRNDEQRIHYLSEDWAFGERARQCGFETWVDPSVILQHRAFVNITVHDIGSRQGMLSPEGAPSKGRSVLVVDPSDQQPHEHRAVVTEGMDDV